MEYFLIRHTRPDIDAGVCYGSLDVDVTASFDDEAEQILHRCRQENIDENAMIYSSPLRRCKVLADFLAGQLNLPVTYDARLRELDFGEWEGKRWDALDRTQSDFWTADVFSRAPPGGETYAALVARVEAFLIEVASPTSRTVIIVSHGGPLRAMLAYLLGLRKKTFPPLDVAIGRISKISTMSTTHGGDGDGEVGGGKGVLQFLNR